jgi:signal recognition particle GTPase
MYLEDSLVASTHEFANDIRAKSKQRDSKQTINDLNQLHISEELAVKVIRRLYQNLSKG